MNYPQEVTFVDTDGKLWAEVFTCETGQQAMTKCRLKHPGCIITGAGREFDKNNSEKS